MKLIPIIHFPSHIVISTSFFGKIGQKRHHLSFLPYFSTYRIFYEGNAGKMAILPMKPMIFVVDRPKIMKMATLAPSTCLQTLKRENNQNTGHQRMYKTVSE
ncbi:MAG: hypothetical protein ACI3YX_00910 [Prevotella sp.]